LQWHLQFSIQVLTYYQPEYQQNIVQQLYPENRHLLEPAVWQVYSLFQVGLLEHFHILFPGNRIQAHYVLQVPAI
jgi:hypothetical protein